MRTFRFQSFLKQPPKTTQFVVLRTIIKLQYCRHLIHLVDANNSSQEK